MFNSNFRHTVKSIFLFVVLFVLVDNVASFMLSGMYKKISTGPGKFNYIGENQFDVLVMGSSTAKAFLSDQIEKKVDRRILNVSLDGSSILFSRCLLDWVTQNHVAPDMIILGIDLFELQDNAWKGNFFANIDKLSPLYGRNQLIDQSLTKDTIQGKLKYSIKSYKFNNIVPSIAIKYFNNDGVYRREKPSGEILSIPVNAKTVEKKFNDYYSPDLRKISLYEDIIATCKKNSIRLVFIAPPLYYPDLQQNQRDKKTEKLFREISKKHNVPFYPITIENYPIFKSNMLFEDVLHLNIEGAKVFSDIVSTIIASQLLQKNGHAN